MCEPGVNKCERTKHKLKQDPYLTPPPAAATAAAASGPAPGSSARLRL